MYKIGPAARGAPSTKRNVISICALSCFEVEVNVEVADCSCDPLSHVCSFAMSFHNQYSLKHPKTPAPAHMVHYRRELSNAIKRGK